MTGHSGFPSAAQRVLDDVCVPGALEHFQAPFEALRSHFLDLPYGLNVHLIRNHGNFGDALIRYGTERFLEDIGAKVTKLDTMPFTRPRKYRIILECLRTHIPIGRPHIVYSGSGAWYEAYANAPSRVALCSKFARDVMVLPTTYSGTFDKHQNVTYWARDHFESLQSMPQAKFCHDMAFYLALVEPDRLLPNRTPPDRDLFICFRVDVEKNFSGRVPQSNFDLSNSGKDNDDAQDFLRHIDQYERVITDRLHVAIGAALLGKEVKLVSNSYFKIRAIFDSSIKGIFPKCEMISDEEAAQLLADVD
ncbi:polysaccharide pyruvyl transferase family protein [Altererythrobacter sp. GH1-8]|uniref:polysaccharide pyruvyl transferase family protein n=1 Tax=Altererythrobacter sp. GH1-8 TaxID=3349333 RepID=UPI00374CB462